LSNKKPSLFENGLSFLSAGVQSFPLVRLQCDQSDKISRDPVLLWLWHRPAAVALIQPLACEPPYALGVTLKRQNK
ncbi:hypothetical protein PS027_23690, partial [Shigella sonnei]|nr:hypothetical protein [Shigella sonnei]